MNSSQHQARKPWRMFAERQQSRTRPNGDPRMVKGASAGSWSLLPQIPVRWGERRSSRRSYREICDIPLDIASEELDRRVRAFGHNHFGLVPTITLHGVEFRAMAPPPAAAAMAANPAGATVNDNRPVSRPVQRWFDGSASLCLVEWQRATTAGTALTHYSRTGMTIPVVAEICSTTRIIRPEPPHAVSDRVTGRRTVRPGRRT